MEIFMPHELVTFYALHLDIFSWSVINNHVIIYKTYEEI